MQDDITDGVNWLINMGIGNPAKVAIYGGSYGGYATLAGLAFTPELYTCGVDYCGLSNLFVFKTVYELVNKKESKPGEAKGACVP